MPKTVANATVRRGTWFPNSVIESRQVVQRDVSPFRVPLLWRSMSQRYRWWFVLASLSLSLSLFLSLWRFLKDASFSRRCACISHACLRGCKRGLRFRLVEHKVLKCGLAKKRIATLTSQAQDPLNSFPASPCMSPNVRAFGVVVILARWSKITCSPVAVSDSGAERIAAETVTSYLQCSALCLHAYVANLNRSLCLSRGVGVFEVGVFMYDAR